MSYGVIASKSAQVMVETTAGSGGAESDVALDRFQSLWGGAFVPGRITVTKLHVNFIPNRAGRGMAMVDINLRDIEQVELNGVRMNKLIGLRTATHLVHVKILAPGGLAQQLATLVEAAKVMPGIRRLPATRPRA